MSAGLGRAESQAPPAAPERGGSQPGILFPSHMCHRTRRMRVFAIPGERPLASSLGDGTRPGLDPAAPSTSHPSGAGDVSRGVDTWANAGVWPRRWRPCRRRTRRCRASARRWRGGSWRWGECSRPAACVCACMHACVRRSAHASPPSTPHRKIMDSYEGTVYQVMGECPAPASGARRWAGWVLSLTLQCPPYLRGCASPCGLRGCWAPAVSGLEAQSLGQVWAHCQLPRFPGAAGVETAVF